MERSLLFQAFVPFRHIGAGFYDWAEDLSSTWTASVFRTGQDQYGNSISTDGGWGGSGRLTWLPWYDEPAGGRYYWHLGSAYYYNSPPRDLVRFRTIPEMFVGEHAPNGVGTSGQAVPGVLLGVPFFVDTGPLLASDVHTFGLESLYVWGPFSLQSEWMAAIVNQSIVAPVATLHGGYAQVGYFLTGEHRPYDRKLGQIDRVKPFEDFFRIDTPHGICTGKGAWELAARLSYIDLNDENINGGDLVDTTLGVNWYLNPYCKIVGNWVHAFLDHPVGGRSDTDLYAVRAQLDF
jgi:phosphate-selective porin OprO/OprP